MAGLPVWYDDHWQALLLFQAMAGVLVFSYALERRERFIPRLLVSLAVGMGAVELITRLLYNRGQVGQFATIALLYLMLIGITVLCYRESLWTVLFVVASGYVTQDLASGVKTILRYPFFPLTQEMASTTPGVLLLDAVCYGGIYLLAYFCFRAFTRRGAESFTSRTKVVFSLVVLLLCAGLTRIARDGSGHSTRVLLALTLYRLLSDVFVLLVQYGVMDRNRLAQRAEALAELAHQQYAQYQASKESAELVNEKYHDLKQLLVTFRGQVSAEQLEKLEESISTYEDFVHTGSDVLDVVLSEKRGLCHQRGIPLTCYADGAGLDFVEELDLYSLFNNALNNAIEAVSQLPQGERFITLTVKREGDMVAIHMENPCCQEVELRGGLPQSARDPRYHGFGMRSMQRVADKYHGSLAVESSGNMFRLDVLLLACAG